jgi:hypothetical protein
MQALRADLGIPSYDDDDTNVDTMTLVARAKWAQTHRAHAKAHEVAQTEAHVVALAHEGVGVGVGVGASAPAPSHAPTGAPAPAPTSAPAPQAPGAHAPMPAPTAASGGAKARKMPFAKFMALLEDHVEYPRAHQEHAGHSLRGQYTEQACESIWVGLPLRGAILGGALL